jgi:hypothetical protein
MASNSVMKSIFQVAAGGGRCGVIATHDLCCQKEPRIFSPRTRVLPRSWMGDRTSFSVRSEVEDANYGHACINGASFGIGGRGCRCHRIQGESKYYEQFIHSHSLHIVTDRLRPAQPTTFHPSHMRYDYSDKSLRGDIHTDSYGAIGGEES